MCVLVLTLFNVLLIGTHCALAGFTPLIGGEASHNPNSQGHKNVGTQQVFPDLNGERIHERKERMWLAFGFLEEENYQNGIMYNISSFSFAYRRTIDIYSFSSIKFR